MSSELLTTREVAELLGVGPTSVKRWADTGLLRCVKTPGGHRRFPREALQEMLRGGEAAQATEEDWVDRWVRMLSEGSGDREVFDALAVEYERVGSWARVGDRLAPVISEVGYRWEIGALSILQEHLASERLLRGIARASDDFALAPDAPRALLVMAQGDEHTIGLALVELTLREAGWNPRWAGRRTPIEQVCDFVRAGQCELVCMSASVHSKDAGSLAAQADRVGRACRERRIDLFLGGRGLWPAAPGYAQRVQQFDDFRGRLLAQSSYKAG